MKKKVRKAVLFLPAIVAMGIMANFLPKTILTERAPIKLYENQTIELMIDGFDAFYSYPSYYYLRFTDEALGLLVSLKFKGDDISTNYDLTPNKTYDAVIDSSTFATINGEKFSITAGQGTKIVDENGYISYSATATFNGTTYVFYDVPPIDVALTIDKYNETVVPPQALFELEDTSQNIAITVYVKDGYQDGVTCNIDNTEPLYTFITIGKRTWQFKELSITRTINEEYNLLYFSMVGITMHGDIISIAFSKEAPADVTQLKDALTDAYNAYFPNENNTNYDKDTMDAFKALYDSSYELSNNSNATQDEVDAATTELINATTALRAYMKDVDDSIAANAVIDLINALPEPSGVTASDKTAVENARASYDALTDDQKNKVSAEVLKKLTDDEQALVDIAAANAVVDKINNLPSAADVTLANKTAIEEARASYNALTDNQKARVSSEVLKKLTDDEQVLADIIAANNFIDKINALPSAADVTLANKTAIEEARTAYDALTDDQKARVSTEVLKKLTDDEKVLADIISANNVIDKINALPEPSAVTLANKTAIEEARASYNALSDDQKNRVSSTALDKLEADEQALVDIAAANAVIDKINALPSSNNVTLEDKTAIEETRAAYNALTDDQKNRVSSTALDKLEADEQALVDIAAANAVIDKINALPSSNNVTLANKTAIEEARAAYNALTDNQKNRVSTEVLKKLTDDEAVIVDILAANAVVDKINNLPSANDVTFANKTAIEEARTAYNALTDDQKARVSTQTLQKLEADEAVIADILAANAVVDKINNLPSANDVTIANKTAIEEARTAYDALTDDQKPRVSSEVLKKLTDDEKVLADIIAANNVIDTINALPSANDVTIANKTTIEEARAAYDALSDAQKNRVSTEVLKKLTDAEKVLADIMAADEVVDKINALLEPSSVTLAHKTAIEEARAAYDALTDAQKGRVGSSVVKKLTDVEAALEKVESDAEAANVVMDKIKSLPSPSDVTPEDKEAIEEARKAYEALTPEQKAMVTDEVVKLLVREEQAVNSVTGLPAGVITVIVINSFLLVVMIACGVLYILHRKRIFILPFFRKKDDEEEKKADDTNN